MSTYRSVTSLRERVLAAVRERGDAQLWAEAEEQLLRE
jgi:hypothetical protein